MKTRFTIFAALLAPLIVAAPAAAHARSTSRRMRRPWSARG